MKINEILTEMPDQKAIAKLKQDAAQLKAMKDSGNMDLNKAMPMMQNMATMAAKADMGSKLLVFFEKMASAIKKGIDTNVYGPADLPTMQKAYDGIMAQMPKLKQMAADSRKLAVQHGAGRQDVGETASVGATSAGAIASVPGNGFANGGPGTIKRQEKKKKKKSKVRTPQPDIGVKG
tara:strand:+ start:258 stop:791 length:534 start_codon:yes stop_codon:yes gene_type:complete